jgi:hypothetical protein
MKQFHILIDDWLKLINSTENLVGKFNNMSPRVNDSSLKMTLTSYLNSLRECKCQSEIIDIILGSLNVFGMQFKPGEVQMTKASSISTMLQSTDNVTRPFGCRNYLHSQFTGCIVYNDRLGFSNVFATLFSLFVDSVEICVLGTVTKLLGSNADMSDVSFDMSNTSMRKSKVKEMLFTLIGKDLSLNPIPKGRGNPNPRGRGMPSNYDLTKLEQNTNDVSTGKRNYSTRARYQDPLVLEFQDNQTKYKLSFKSVKLLNEFLASRGKSFIT